jgi:hypothetical protein
VNALLEHVVELAIDMGVRVWVALECTEAWGLAEEYDMAGARPAVWLGRLPIEPVPYFIALHELGHHADPAGWGRRAKLALDREAYAWRWALAEARVPADKAVWADILDALSSYARNRRYKLTPDFNDLLEDAGEALLNAV